MDQAELIARGERASALAERWPAQRGFELDPDGWRRLLKAAEQEPERDSPASAAVWEALWRDDHHLTPAAWVKGGPQDPDGEPLNPFLHAERYREREAARSLSRLDRQAGSLLDAAIRAESVRRWWDTPHLVIQYGAVHAEADQFLRAYGLERESDSGIASDGRDAEPSPLEPQLPPNRLEDMQIALTRLLLVGHRATTTQILPPLLATVQGEPGAPLEQTRIVQFAMRRLGPGSRVVTAARSAASASVPALRGRAKSEAAALRVGTITAILLGTLFGGSRDTRSKDSRDSRPMRLDA